ncbi:hypothetical protein ACTD5D_19330 [Nocardia takedensis]|uniref:hypothetical protein n=1 Tax=Nocardia takedensis TaxID=259390 RepID=UPI003F7712AB
MFAHHHPLPFSYSEFSSFPVCPRTLVRSRTQPKPLPIAKAQRFFRRSSDLDSTVAKQEHHVRVSTQPTDSLDAALEKFCRNGARAMTTTALAATDGRIFDALTGHSPTEPTDRQALARWIVEYILDAIGSITDPIDKTVAEIAFAANPDLHGCYVAERIKAACDARILSSKDQYWDRRPRVFTEITTGLRQAYRTRFPSRFRVFLAAYGTDREWESTHAAIGIKLAQLSPRVDLLSMASRDALLIGYAMAAQTRLTDTYTSERYTVFRRVGFRRPQPIQRGLGRTDCLEGTLDEVRHSILARCDAVVLIGGDDGTAYEAALADELRCPVIPVPASGGAAKRYFDTGASLFPEIVSAYDDLAVTDRTALPDTVTRVLTTVIGTHDGRGHARPHAGECTG